MSSQLFFCKINDNMIFFDVCGQPNNSYAFSKKWETYSYNIVADKPILKFVDEN